MTKPVKMLPAMLSALIIAVPVNTASAAQMTVGDLQEICIAHDEGSTNACKFYLPLRLKQGGLLRS